MVAAAGVAGAIVLLVGPATAADQKVAGLQVALKARGLYHGAIDGIEGPQTRRAVLAFQRRKGLVVDGIVGPRTRRALGRLGRPPLGKRLIVRGALGWDVSVLQFLLRRRGFDPGPLDGEMGGRTAAALRAFQHSMGLSPDAVVGPATLAALSRGARSRPAGAYTKIVVQRGETLSLLAERHRTTVAALAKLNRLDPKRFLLEGAVLRVPAATAAIAGRAPATTMSHDEVRALIDRWAGVYGVDPSLARALAWMESGFQTNLTSEAGAWGVMQIIPSTWDFVQAVLAGQTFPRTAEGNIRVGLLYLRHLLRRFNGSERLALAGWYQGERAVREHGVYKESKWFAKVVLGLRRNGI
ncbi:MAG TPA: peptidoglycan-binding protein [Gaiellaceae bacterium]|jgi:peptidoglycan hydrolase-like protein with peptidoglycan-binding domain|nr:peptidoglycan-binding protein [Gaiellaceae bacterium]